jgi:hypothetical protein
MIVSTVKPVYNGHPWDLGPEKRGRYAEGYMKNISGKKGLRLAVRAADWPLFRGGRILTVFENSL